MAIKKEFIDWSWYWILIINLIGLRNIQKLSEAHVWPCLWIFFKEDRVCDYKLKGETCPEYGGIIKLGEALGGTKVQEEESSQHRLLPSLHAGCNELSTFPPFHPSHERFLPHHRPKISEVSQPWTAASGTVSHSKPVPTKLFLVFCHSNAKLLRWIFNFSLWKSKS